MRQSSPQTIRTLLFSDLPGLSEFFLKAYGPETVFQDTGFLEWYFFGGKENRRKEAEGCIICLARDQKTIVSFYGGLPSELISEGKVISAAWGVNAYVLPAYRDQNLSTGSLEVAKSKTQVHGVIGFTEKTAEFYKNQGYNLFGFQRFSRYVHVISEEKTRIAAASLHSDLLLQLPKKAPVQAKSASVKNITVLRLSSLNINGIGLDLPVSVKLTTHRDKAFLLNRFLLHPYINYQVFAVVSDNRIVAYCASRDEILEPLGFTVSRLIDLFGKPEYAPALLNFMAARAEERAHAYVDFSSFGILFQTELANAGFYKFDKEEYAVLPQVTAPVEPRPNMEFIGLFSNSPDLNIGKLSAEDVYFTRADSDRDRLARLTQLPELQLKNE